jgi:uncharacterized protein
VNNHSPDLRRTLLFCLLLTACCLFLALSGCDKFKSPTVPRASAPKPAHPSVNHAARLAIILDDVAGDPTAVDEIFALSNKLTLSVLPNHPRSIEVAEEAHRRGYEVMLHLPMESEANETPEVRQLRPGMTAPEIATDLNEMLQTVPFAAGVNNHQGSRATSDAKLMDELMPLLRQRKLFFIDSRTTAATVAYETAERDGVRTGFRNVPFLDDVQESGAIREQLERAVHGAKEKGEAIVIGHPHPETLRVLREMLPQIQAQGVELVHASALVHLSTSH